HINSPETNREKIAQLAVEREEDNRAFREYLNRKDGAHVDSIVHRLNETIAPQIDCTECGACCRQLMINVTDYDAQRMAGHLGCSSQVFKEKYVEAGSSMMIMNSIPCHFLADNKCTAYEARFTECREFPDLHKENFKGRLFATMIHYAMCPIIFNVVEELKTETRFRDTGSGR
ncbi:MAG: YkgJ family cysteine cluster protein, partial [Sphingobacteriales bacterium]